MPVLVQLEAKAKPGNIEDLMLLVRGELSATRSHEGCREVTGYLNDDGHTVVFVGKWDSIEQYRAYSAWRQETGVMSDFLGLLEGPPSVRFFEAIDA